MAIPAWVSSIFDRVRGRRSPTPASDRNGHANGTNGHTRNGHTRAELPPYAIPIEEELLPVAEVEAYPEDDVLPSAEIDQLPPRERTEFEETVESSEWVVGASTNVEQFRYFFDDKVLEVEFRNGSLYQYYDVPPEVFYGMVKSTSRGRFVWNHLRDIYAYARVSKGDKKIKTGSKNKNVVRLDNIINVGRTGRRAHVEDQVAKIRKEFRL